MGVNGLAETFLGIVMKPPEKVTKSRETSETIIFQAQFALCRFRADVRELS